MGMFREDQYNDVLKKKKRTTKTKSVNMINNKVIKQVKRLRQLGNNLFLNHQGSTYCVYGFGKPDLP